MSSSALSSTSSSPHFHTHSPRSSFAPTAHRSPTHHRSSPRHSALSPSPRRAFNAPAGPSQPSKQYGVESGAGGGGFAGYVHAGTQYSPAGSPPTSGRKLAAAVGKPSGAATGISVAKKRKETSTAESSGTEESMSGSSAESGGAQRPLRQRQPDEPQLRSDPVGSTSAATTTSTTSAISSADAAEPQEARSTHGHSAKPKRPRADAGTLKAMPLKYEDANPKDLGVLISNMLMELIRINDRIPLRDGRLTRFHSRAPPGISVSDYLQRLIQHATLSPPILLSMVYYIDRLCTMYPAFTINSLTVHRFLITAATVAAKGLSDSFWTNPTYARIGGIPVSELATLELELLERVEWKIVPKPEVLEDYYASLVDRTDGYVMEGSGSSDGSSSLADNDVLSKAGSEKRSKAQDEDMDET